jgi:ATP-dependent exoDNAse (exonuclease V) beta subunit
VSFEPNEEQRQAIAADGLVFVSAGAGTGKTRVLVERFARAVLEREIAPDRILAITYTERAAAELQARIRGRLREADRPDLARALDGAWISTIHGFCQRVLRRHALAAGLDPGFSVLDAAGAAQLRTASYREALDDAVRADDDVLDLITDYGDEPLRKLIGATHERLRAAGARVAFPLPAPVELAAVAADVVAAARELVAAEGDARRLSDARERASTLIELLERGLSPAMLVDLGAFRPHGALEAGARLRDALAALEAAARDARYVQLHPQLEAVLAAFAATYARRKRAASVLDFDDLQLEVRALLDARPDVRLELAGRFAQVMVDEFQDTNELQCAIIDHLVPAGGDLFFVGDEFQSIYRFRHADVDVFRGRHAATRALEGASTISLTTNYRSRPEVLSVVNHLFGAAFGSGYEPLAAGGAFPELAEHEPAVEFLVTDARRARAAGLEPREADAAAVARRIRTLVDEGSCRAGEVVLLFSAGTDAGLYEDALREEGFDTASATNRAYYASQGLRDVLAYLRLIRNRYDDVALLSVLASPLVGVSNDALVLLRGVAQHGLFAAIENGVPAALGAEDGQLVAGFRQRFDRLVEVAGRVDLATLIEQVILRHDYDLALLTHPTGVRRTANLRKLVRIARAYEAANGPNLEGFIEVVEARRGGEKEPEALTTEEAADAVRLLTVHAAKGLQFRVVVVADAGRRESAAGESLVALPDGRVGVKVPGADGALHETSRYTEAAGIDRAADDAERRRVSYVALTRAIDRLIVSGCVSEGAGSTPIAWMLRELGVSPPADDVERRDEASIVDVPGGSVTVRFWDPGEDLDETETNPQVDADGQLAIFADHREVDPLPAPVPVVVPPAPTPIQSAPPERPGRLSFSALHLYEQCGYRFAAERLLGFQRKRPDPQQAAADGAGLNGAELGSVVHAALEHPERPLDDALAGYPHHTAENRARAESLVAAWRTSEAALAIDGLAVRRELPFLLRVGGSDLAGFIDLVAEDGERNATVVDYKTNRIGDRDLAAYHAEEYGLQEAVYALALLDAGAPSVAVRYVYLDTGETITTPYTAADADPLRARVTAAVAAAVTGPYRARPGVQCGECPVLGMLCAGPDLADAWHG